jgi:hypothetical protein
MYLILLLVIFLVLGYFLSRSRISGSIDKSTEKALDLAARNKNWWSSRLGNRRKNLTFIHWVNRNGVNYLPEEFAIWLNDLSEIERHEFVYALGDFMQGLGYDLKKLDDGSLDNKPALLQIYVEAVVIYSNAYRKAKQAQKEAEKTKQNTPSNGNQPEGRDEVPVVVNLPEIAEPVPAG